MKRERTLGGLLALVVAGSVLALTPAPSHATGTNDPDHWEDQPGEVCLKVDDRGTDGGGYQVPAEPPGRDWSTLIIKKGSGNDQNDVVEKPVAGQTYLWQGQNNGYSHVILCSIPQQTPPPPPDACPDMPGTQPPGTTCTTPVPAPPLPPAPAPAPAPEPAPATAPVTAPAVEVLGEQRGRATGRLYTSCQRTVRITMNNSTSRTVAYKLLVGKKSKTLRVRADSTRQFTTRGQHRSIAKLMLGTKVLAEKRVPGACSRPEVLPATGKRQS